MKLEAGDSEVLQAETKRTILDPIPCSCLQIDAQIWGVELANHMSSCAQIVYSLFESFEAWIVVSLVLSISVEHIYSIVKAGVNE